MASPCVDCGKCSLSIAIGDPAECHALEIAGSGARVTRAIC